LTKKLSRYLIFATLLIWGAVFLRFWVAGELGRYLHPEFHWFVLFSGVGLILMSGAWYWATSFGGQKSCSHCCGGGGEGAGSKNIVGCLVLLASLGGALFFSEGKFNEVHLINRLMIFDVKQAPTLMEESRVKKLNELILEEHETIDIGIDLAVLAGDKKEWREALDNREVSMLGQMRYDKGEAYLVRMLSVCCAADARPLAVALGEVDTRFRNGEWIKGTGKLEYRKDETSFRPTLIDFRLESEGEPENPILY
jgi:hypothetical protein